MSETASPTPTDSTAAPSPAATGSPDDFPNLLPRHLDMLRASGISPDVIRERGYRSIETKIELKRLGFADYQQRVPALFVPVPNVHGEIATYQIRPDTARIDKKSGKSIKYETPADRHLALDVPSRTRAVIGTPKVALFITEGAKKVDALLTHGLSAIGVLGVWAWRGTNEDGGKTALADIEFIAWNGRTVYLVFDSDTWTKIGVYKALARLKNLLESRGANVKVIYLPTADGCGKTGVDDYLAAGHDVDDLLALASDELRRPPLAEEYEKPYVVRDGGIWWMKATDAGELAPVQLTNFDAKIVAQVVEDDGVAEKKLLEIEASRGGKTTTFRLAPSEFSKVDWPIERIGADAWVAPGGRSMRERAVVAIQELSGEVPERRVYSHTGWRKIGDKNAYLHAAGAHDQDGFVATVEVSLPAQLAGMSLPPPPAPPRLRECWAAVLRFLDVAPAKIVHPLFAHIWRTVIASVDFTPHLEGETGFLKSEVAALVQQFFGKGLNARSLPGSWSSTANSLERLAFQAMNAVFVVDDFVPRGFAQDIQRLHREAERLLRAQGNQSGRSRMAADSSLRPTYWPRGGILSTGEETPVGQSLLARILVLHVARGDVDPVKLSQCQIDAAEGLYAEFTAAFVVWLASRRDQILKEMKSEVVRLRDAGTGPAAHRRTPEVVANLVYGLKVVMRFVEEKGLASEDDATAIEMTGWNAIYAAAAAHGKQQSPAAPHARFVAIVSAALVSGRAHLAAQDGGAPEKGGHWGWRLDRAGEEPVLRPQGERIGWIDGDDVYLLPDAAYTAAQRIAAAQGEPLGVSITTLQKRMKENGLLVATDATRETLTIRKTFEGRQQKVLRLLAAALGVGPDVPKDDDFSAAGAGAGK